MSDHRPHVVILGAGYAGSSCVKELQRQLKPSSVRITFVDKRSCAIHKIASHRAAVVGNDYARRALIPLNNLLRADYGTLLLDSIKSISLAQTPESGRFPKVNVELVKNGVLEADYLVCATGARNLSIMEPPLNKKHASVDSIVKFYERVSKKIRPAKRIVILGGGASGVELAGEIRYEYPDKEIYIVHRGDKLCRSTKPELPSRFHKVLENKLKQMRIDVYYNCIAQLPKETFDSKPYIQPEGAIRLSNGTVIAADLVLSCFGRKSSSRVYPEDWRDSATNLLRVRNTLQLMLYDSIFAIGDLCDVERTKLAYNAGKHGIVAAKNITKLINNFRLAKTKLVKFSPGRSSFLISLGRKRGAISMGNFVFGDFVTRRLKSRDLFVPRAWKAYNQSDFIPTELWGASKGGKRTAGGTETEQRGKVLAASPNGLQSTATLDQVFSQYGSNMDSMLLSGANATAATRMQLGVNSKIQTRDIHSSNGQTPRDLFISVLPGAESENVKSPLKREYSVVPPPVNSSGRQVSKMFEESESEGEEEEDDDTGVDSSRTASREVKSNNRRAEELKRNPGAVNRVMKGMDLLQTKIDGRDEAISFVGMRDAPSVNMDKLAQASKMNVKSPVMMYPMPEKEESFKTPKPSSREEFEASILQTRGVNQQKANSGHEEIFEKFSTGTQSVSRKRNTAQTEEEKIMEILSSRKASSFASIEKASQNQKSKKLKKKKKKKHGKKRATKLESDSKLKRGTKLERESRLKRGTKLERLPKSPSKGLQEEPKGQPRDEIYSFVGMRDIAGKSVDLIRGEANEFNMPQSPAFFRPMSPDTIDRSRKKSK